MQVRIYTLFSGSGGNCHFLSVGGDTILFDAGKNAKAIKEALSAVGGVPESIRAVFVTHSHIDHTAALRVLLRQYPAIRVFTSEGCASCLHRCDIPTDRITVLLPHRAVSVCGVRVTAFPIPHDSGDCVGYRAEYESGDTSVKLGIATDIGYLTPDIADGLYGCDTVIVEANHDTEMLKNGPYPYELKQRILSRGGHLSNDSCARLLTYLSENGTECAMLAHLSKENNTPRLALDCVRRSVGDRFLRLCAADPDRPTMLRDTREE